MSQLSIARVAALSVLTLSLVSSLNVMADSNGTTNPGAAAQLQQEMSEMFRVIETEYGPLSIKPKTIGLDWNRTKADYLDKAGRVSSDREFYSLIVQLLDGFNDAHVSIELPSSLKAKLPVQFSLVESRVIVTYVDQSKLPKSAKVPQIGDELVKINGMLLDQVQRSQPAFNKYGNDLTNKSMFTHYLSSMSEAGGFNIANMSPDVTLELKSVVDGSTYEDKLKYDLDGVALIDRPVLPTTRPTEDQINLRQASYRTLEGSGMAPGFSIIDRARLEAIDNLMVRVNALFNLATELKTENASQVAGLGRPFALGGRTPLFKLPSDFKEIRPTGFGSLLNASTFFAGTFNHNGKRIGFLRIPEYNPGVTYALPMAVRYFIGQLEKKSDVLIIDQTNNPGGAVIMSDLLIKSLVGQYDASKHLRFAVKPTQGFMREFAEILNAVDNDKTGAISKEMKVKVDALVKPELEKVRQAYVSGAPLSEPVSLYVISEVFEESIDSIFAKFQKPAATVSKLFLGVNVFQPQVYTKPVYFVTNELDFSGGDATPATFQDYGRGPIVGVRTAGAGGTVEQFSHREATEFSYHLTTSLMIRKDGGLVENYGVQPNIPFSFTIQDYRDGFAHSLDRLLNTLRL